MIRDLSDVPFDEIYDTFRDAFSDYATGAGTLSETGLRNRAIKNGWNAACSAGAFDGERLVGITLVGLDEFGGGAAAYDIATGIRPSHRGRGLAGAMMEALSARLRERGVARFYLEVLRENAAAIRAYEKAGFEVRRRFECFRRESDGPARAPGDGIRVEPADRRVLDRARDWLDWEPSWENTLSSLARVPDELVVLEAASNDGPCGVAAWHAPSGWIHTVAVRPDTRRRGVASALLAELGESYPAADFKLNNVPDDDEGMLAFAAASGFRFYVGQFEMVRSLAY